MPTKSNASSLPSPSDTSAPPAHEWERNAASLKPFHVWCSQPENQAAVNRWQTAYSTPEAEAARNKISESGYMTNTKNTPEERFVRLYFGFCGTLAQEQRNAIATEAMLLLMEAAKPSSISGETSPLASFFKQLSGTFDKIDRKERTEKDKVKSQREIDAAFIKLAQDLGRLPDKGELELAAFGNLSEDSHGSRRSQFNKWLKLLGLGGLPERAAKPREQGAVRARKTQR